MEKRETPPIFTPFVVLFLPEVLLPPAALATD